MKTEKLHLVWAHPRTDSFTAQVVREMQDQAAQQGITVSNLDLYSSNFDPVLAAHDEPDWNNPKKQYSEDIHRLYAAIEESDTIVMVFPVWWFSFPAMMKGYLDRVWTNGLAYGEGSSLKGKKFRYVALVGGTESGFGKYGWENHMRDYVVRMMNYLTVEDTRIDFLYNTLGMEEEISASHYQQLLAQARGIVTALQS